MDDSTSTLLYTATYVFIFIIAVSLSIVMFLSVNKYADSAFEYSNNLSSSIINTPTTGTEEKQTGKVHLTSSDVFSYFVNYVKKDLYGNNNQSNSEYNVTIITDDGKLDSELSYHEALKKIGNKNYILKYKENKKIEITNAT